jgi:hypothetical protein
MYNMCFFRGAQARENFHFGYFYTTKPLWVGDFGAKIFFFNCRGRHENVPSAYAQHVFKKQFLLERPKKFNMSL